MLYFYFSIHLSVAFPDIYDYEYILRCIQANRKISMFRNIFFSFCCCCYFPSFFISRIIFQSGSFKFHIIAFTQRDKSPKSTRSSDIPRGNIPIGAHLSSFPPTKRPFFSFLQRSQNSILSFSMFKNTLKFF